MGTLSFFIQFSQHNRNSLMTNPTTSTSHATSHGCLPLLSYSSSVKVVQRSIPTLELTFGPHLGINNVSLLFELYTCQISQRPASYIRATSPSTYYHTGGATDYRVVLLPVIRALTRERARLPCSRV
jgi:hypothetical protein